MAVIQEERLQDFKGGLNLRSDAYHLKRNESPDLLNVDVDPRAGVRSRKSWESTHSTALPSDVRRLHSWLRLSGAVQTVAALENGEVWTSPAGGEFSEVLSSSLSLDCAGTPQRAEFVEWSDELYIHGGAAGTSYRWDGAAQAVALTASGSGAWQEDYTAPVGGHMPHAEHATTYLGYHVVANTTENGVRYPNRIRFSHPNNPEDWRELDYFDIGDGGPEITGIVAFDDHVLIFKQQSLHAIYGYSRDSFSPVSLTGDAGCPNANAYAVAVQSCYFYSHPDGVMEYIPNQGVKEHSLQLRPIIDSGELNVNALDTICLGWLNKRLWFGAPYKKGEAGPAGVKTVFVLDPSLEAWTRFVGGDGGGLGPFAAGGGRSADGSMLAYAPDSNYVMEVDVDHTSADVYGAVSAPMSSYFKTRWVNGGTDATKKLWRRPEYVVSELDAPYTMQVEVFRDLNEANPRSRHNVSVETGSAGAVWGSFNWNDGTIYGEPPAGAHYERGGSIGLGKSIQLNFKGTDGEPWGVNALIMKFKERRLR